MSQAGSLRAERLRRAHQRLLDAAEDYPNWYLIGFAHGRFHGNNSPKGQSSLVTPRFDDDELLAVLWNSTLDFGGNDAEYVYPFGHFHTLDTLWTARFVELSYNSVNVAKPDEVKWLFNLDILSNISRELEDDARAYFGPNPLERTSRSGRSVGYHPTWLDYVARAVSPQIERVTVRNGTPGSEYWLWSCLKSIYVASALVVEALAREPDTKVPAVLTDSESAVIAALREVGTALTGKELARKLEKMGVDGCSLGNLTRHVLPRLVEKNLVANRRGAGYYLLGE